VSKVVGFVVGAIEIGIGLTVPGMQFLVAQGVMTIVAQAVVDLTQPKTPARDASEMTIKLGEQPRCMLVGETFTAGTLVDGFDFGGNYGTDWEVLIIRLADEPCEGLTGFYVNDEYVLYTGDGNYPQFDTHHFQLYFRANTSVDPLPDIVLDNGPGWTSADIGQSGCDVIVAYLADKPDAKHPAWPGGRPRFGFVVKGGKRYDPRKDSTVTGGSGSHRWDDPATWEWSENAIICWYNYERGVYADGDTSDQTKLLVGRGLSEEESPPENIFAAANLCDELQAATFPYRLLTPATSLQGASFSPDWSMMVLLNGTVWQMWYLPTLTLWASGTIPNSGTTHVAVNDDYSFYVGGYALDRVALIHPGGSVTDVTASGDKMGHTFLLSEGVFGTYDTPANTMLKLTGGTITPTVIGFHPDRYIRNAAGDGFAVGGQALGGAYVNGVGFYDISGASEHLVATGASGQAVAIDNGNGKWFLQQGNKIRLIDQATYAVTAGPVTTTSSLAFTEGAAGQEDVWIGNERYSTADLSLIETITPSDWATGTSSGSERVYDRFNDALWSRGTLESVYTVRELHRHGGWRVAGPIYANQNFIDVEDMFAKATAGAIITHEGQVLIEPGQAKSVVASFTDDDLLAGSKVSWNQNFLSESSDEWLNTVVATYVEPDQKWNSHATPPMRVDADIVADGKPREQQIQLRLVRYQPQALRIAEIARRMGRLWGRATVTLGPRFCELEENDWIQWTSDRYFSGSTKTFRVEAYQINEKWQITLSLREINGTVFADDADFPVDLSQPARTPPPPDTSTPDSGDWALAAVTLTSAGAVVPALEITGALPDEESAEAIIVEYWKDDGVGDPLSDPDSVTWTMEGTHAPSTTKVDITSITPGATYYAAISYVVSGIPGDRLVLGPVTVADIDVSPQVTPIVNALPWKAAVRAKTTAALAANTYANGTSGVGATLTANANGALAAQDGVTLVVGNRLLVANEATGSHNGIYVVTQVGDGSHPYILTRATDADTAAELVNATVKVSEGTAAADQEWQCTTNAPITVGTTALVWASATITFATASDINTGTDTTKALNSDALAGSNLGKAVITLLVSDPAGSAITTGDGKAYYRVPSALNGMNLVSVAAALTTVSSSGIPTIQIANVTDSVDMLSTKLTIDASETDSSTAATPAVIDGAHDDVATADLLRIDIDVAGTGAKGLMVEMQFQLP
jgi:hypothetical protein